MSSSSINPQRTTDVARHLDQPAANGRPQTDHTDGHTSASLLAQPIHHAHNSQIDNRPPAAEHPHESASASLDTIPISAKFALSMTMQLDTSLEWDKLKPDIHRRMNKAGLTPSRKDTYGLKNGDVLCLWVTTGDAHARHIKELLSKNGPRTKLRDQGVFSVTCHENCTAHITEKGFESYFDDRGETEVIKIEHKSSKNHGVPAKTAQVSQSTTMPSSSYIPQTQASGSNLPSLPTQSMFGYKNLAQESVREPHARDPHLPYRQSASVCLEDTPHPSKAGISSPVSPNFSSPPRYPAWPQTLGMPSHVQNSQINHSVAPAIHIGSQKRSATASDLSEHLGGMKRARQETSENQTSGATSSQLHEAIAARKTAEKALKAECEGWHAERSCIKQAWKKDLDRLSKAREADVQKRNDLEKQVEELHVELRTLRETLTTVQEDYQKTARHNQELRAAAEEAMRNERRLAGENARLIDAERAAHEAQERAEESRISVMEIQKAAEEALASERCRRMAAEQALLDVTSVLNGVDAMIVCPRP